MPFLTLNSTTIRVKSNSADQKDNEHRVDRERMFAGNMRVFRGPIFRQWDITTAILDPTTYATVRALINSNSVPLSASGDLIGGTVDVIPVPSSWTPVQSPGISGGFGWVGRFTLHENPTPAPIDTSALPWAFYRRGAGYYTDSGKTTPAGIGDLVLVWEDSSGNARDATSDVGSENNRPELAATNELLFGHHPTSAAGRSGFETPATGALTEIEIMLAVRAENDPPDIGSPGYRNLMQFSRSGGDATKYPDAFGHIQEATGRDATGLIDMGDPVVDLTGWNVYDVSASTITNQLTGYLNGALLHQEDLTAGAFVFDGSNVIAVSGDETHAFQGRIKDFVIFDFVLSDTQRLAWTNYLLGVTSRPPIA